MDVYTYGPEEAKEIAETCFKTPGKGAFEFRYVDIPKAAVIMRSYREKKGLGMKVEIAIKREVKLRKQAGIVKNYKNNVCPFTRLIYGKFKGINPTTQLAQWDNIELSEFQSFDLSNDADAANWMVLRLSSAIEGSVNADKSPEFALWQFNDLRAANVDNIGKVRNIVKISEIVSSVSGYDLANLGRLFGFTISPGEEHSLKIVDLEGFLLRIAYENPDMWLSKFRDGNRSYHELLFAGQATGAIQFNHTEGWSAMGNQIGQTEDDAIAYLKIDKNLYSLIKANISQNDKLANYMERQRPEVLTKGEKIGTTKKGPKAEEKEEEVI
jgi:hypothetical protein